MKDSIKQVSGKVQIFHYDENKNLINEYEFDNLVVTSGLTWIANRLTDPPDVIMNYIAVGTDNTTPTLAQTALVSELYRAAVSISGGTVSTNNLLFTQTIPPGSATGALQEAGIFTLGSGGTMLSRVTYPVINKGASDTIAINWTITIG